MDMDEFIKAIGVAVVSAIIVTIPLLCGLSFALGWHNSIQWMLILGTLGVFSFVAFLIEEKTNG